MIPTTPHHDDNARPRPIISNPTSILAILSVSPTLHVMINYLVFVNVIIVAATLIVKTADKARSILLRIRIGT